MNKAQILLLSVLIASFANCSPARVISKKTFTQNYYNLIFSPEKNQKTTLGGVEITISPIDAASINRETFESAGRDGNYEKEFARLIEKQKSESDRLSKSEKAYIQSRLNAIKAVEKLEKDNLIPKDIAFLLMQRIWYGKEIGKEGTETTCLSDIDNAPDIYNPFKINQKYLSVFKITLENKGKEIQKIETNQIQVASEEELLYPLKMEYFENNLKDDPEKIKNAYRLNMPQELTIAPLQKTTKYIAIPAINPHNKNLKIQIITGNAVSNFDFEVSEQIEKRNYQMESYDMFILGLDDAYNKDYYFAISYENGVSFAMLNSRIFVNEEKKSTLASIYAVAIDKSTFKVSTARKVSFKFAELEKNKVPIRFGK
jgi:hypothetical protein